MTVGSVNIDSVILKRVATGDESAFSELFHHYKQLVYHVAWTYVEDTQIADEILQDVFMSIWKNRDKINEITDFNAYLYVIAKNRSLKVLKGIIKDKRRESDRAIYYNNLWEQEFLNDYSEKEVQQLLEQALLLLSPQQRNVFELSRMQGMSREEVAMRLNISKATVSVHLTIALRLIRAFLTSRISLYAGLVIFPEIF